MNLLLCDINYVQRLDSNGFNHGLESATSMLATDVGDEIYVAITLRCWWRFWPILSPISKFCHQHPKIVTNIKSPTSTCHQHLCSPWNHKGMLLTCFNPLSKFNCDTNIPGCSNICFNRFQPISPIRFWGCQILFVAAPSIIYVLWSGHDSEGRSRVRKNLNLPNLEQD